MARHLELPVQNVDRGWDRQTDRDLVTVASDGRTSRHSALPAIGFDALPETLRATLGPRVERLGYLGEFFQRGAHQPDVLLAFHQFTEEGKHALGEQLTEIVALTVSVELHNEYERHQHQRLSVRQGRSREWVAAIERRNPDNEDLLDEGERDAQSVVLALIRDHGHGARSALESYAQGYGAPQTVALMFVVGRYLAHALVVNSLELEPPVPTIFSDGFSAG